MAKLTVVPVTKDGLNPATGLVAAAAGGDYFEYQPGLMVVAKNTDAAAATITIAAPVATVETTSFGSAAITSIAVTVPITTGERWITVPPGFAAGGNISMTYDSVTALTIGVVSV